MKRARRDNLIPAKMTTMASSMWQLKNKLYTYERRIKPIASCRKFRQVQVVRIAKNIATLSQQLNKKGASQ